MQTFADITPKQRRAEARRLCKQPRLLNDHVLQARQLVRWAVEHGRPHVHLWAIGKGRGSGLRRDVFEAAMNERSLLNAQHVLDFKWIDPNSN